MKYGKFKYGTAKYGITHDDTRHLIINVGKIGLSLARQGVGSRTGLASVKNIVVASDRTGEGLKVVTVSVKKPVVYTFRGGHGLRQHMTDIKPVEGHSDRQGVGSRSKAADVGKVNISSIGKAAAYRVAGIGFDMTVSAEFLGRVMRKLIANVTLSAKIKRRIPPIHVAIDTRERFTEMASIERMATLNEQNRSPEIETRERYAEMEVVD